MFYTRKLKCKTKSNTWLQLEALSLYTQQEVPVMHMLSFASPWLKRVFSRGKGCCTSSGEATEHGKWARLPKDRRYNRGKPQLDWATAKSWEQPANLKWMCRAWVVVLQHTVAEIDEAKQRSKYSHAKRKWAGGELHIHSASSCSTFTSCYAFSEF